MPVRGHPNQPAFVAHTLAFVAALRGVEAAELAQTVQATRRACSAGHERSAHAPVQPSLRRMREFGVRPDRDLGQNFLIDSNILGVIGRAAELEARDVVLEIGGGLGVLSEHLAERVGHVHVVEIDERLRARSSTRPARMPNVAVHWADAMTHRPGALAPRPEKVVANLPYGIAAGVLLRTIEELARRSTRWVAMVQREVGERLAGSPGGGSYGTPSVLAQLECEVEVLRGDPPQRLLPGPERRLGADRHGAARPRRGPARHPPALRALVRLVRAPAKDAGRSVALGGGRPRAAPASRSACPAAAGPPADARAERLTPDDFRALAELLGHERCGPCARKDQPRPLPRPGRPPDARHELVSVMRRSRWPTS